MTGWRKQNLEKNKETIGIKRKDERESNSKKKRDFIALKKEQIMMYMTFKVRITINYYCSFH